MNFNFRFTPTSGLSPGFFLVALLLFDTLLPSRAQTSAFTYQGHLNDSGGAANGTYDLRFAIYDALTGGAQQGGAVTNGASSVSNGLFTVTLDFGNQFPGDDRFLEISVRTNGSGDFITLAPRQPITSTPYAITAGTLTGPVASTNLSGAYSSAVTFNNASNQFAGAFSGNGAGVSNVNATTLGGLGESDFWKTGGNAGTAAGIQFFGTTDNQPLEIKVNSTRVARFEYTGANFGPNLIAGSGGNSVGAFARGVTIGGGGEVANSATNAADANFATIAGGYFNRIETSAFVATIGGGENNTIQTGAFDSTIAGGHANTILSNAIKATISGGEGNTIQTNSSYSTIGGGGNNTIQSNLIAATMGGGYANAIQADASYSAIGGGHNNSIQTSAAESTIAGGEQNLIGSIAGGAAIGGGYSNSISFHAIMATISGGRVNTIETECQNSTIGGGIVNSIRGYANDATISGGGQNTIQTNASASTIGGGFQNTIASSNAYSTISGGWLNTIDTIASDSVIAGGQFNTIQSNAFLSVIGGGGQNVIRASATHATVGGGVLNLIQEGALHSTISGGDQNIIQSNAVNSTIGGGIQNTIQTNASSSTIGGGNFNTIQSNSYYSTISGGAANSVQATADSSTISGGEGNSIRSNAPGGVIAGGVLNIIQPNAMASTIGGGNINTNTGPFATIPGGTQNVAGTNSFAAGHRAKAAHTGSFVWADSTDTNFVTTGANQFLIRASGGVAIGTNDPAGAALRVAGTLSADTISGGGAALTSLNASNLTSGTVADARLSSNVALLNANQTFTGSYSFANGANTFNGNGSQLNSLNASQLTFGTVPDSRLSTNVALLNSNQTFTGTNTFVGTLAAGAFNGNGAAVTSMNASNLSNGTVADARLSANVPLLNASQTFSGSNNFSGNVAVSGLFKLTRTSLVPAANSTLTPTNGFFVLSPSSAITLNTTTAIADPTGGSSAAGSILILQGASNGNTVTINTGANTALGAASRTLGLNDTLTLIYSGSTWVEMSFANN